MFLNVMLDGFCRKVIQPDGVFFRMIINAVISGLPFGFSYQRVSLLKQPLVLRDQRMSTDLVLQLIAAHIACH